MGETYPWLSEVVNAIRSVYGTDLVSLAVFGSWARGKATPVSDLDLLVVADPLPVGRGARMKQFTGVDALTAATRRSVWGPEHPPLELSPVIKTPSEVRHGSPLFLDMTEWVTLLIDRDDFLARYLDDLRERMIRNGTERRMAKGGYYWVYKPDAKPGEVITL